VIAATSVCYRKFDSFPIAGAIHKKLSSVRPRTREE
jgi:hypothetical protein